MVWNRLERKLFRDRVLRKKQRSRVDGSFAVPPAVLLRRRRKKLAKKSRENSW